MNCDTGLIMLGLFILLVCIILPSYAAAAYSITLNLSHPNHAFPRHHRPVIGSSGNFAIFHSTSLRLRMMTKMVLNNKVGDTGNDEKGEEEKEKKENVDAFDPWDVTDEDTLLACRAYLQRHNKLGGWVEAVERKTMRMDLLANPSLAFDSGSSGGAGYFWEDPDELLYLRKGKARLFSSKKGSESNDGDDDNNDSDDNSDKFRDAYAENIDRVRRRKKIDRDLFSIEEPSVDSGSETGVTIDGMEPWSNRRLNGFSADPGEIIGIFTSLPLYPSSESVKKSAAKKKLFADEEWKARWYKSRWGGVFDSEEKENHGIYHSINNSSININSPKIRLRVQSEVEKRRRKNERLLMNVPSTTFVSPKFMEMTEDEISHAVRTYKQANQRRQKSHLIKKNIHADHSTLNEEEEKEYTVRDKSPQQGSTITPFAVGKMDDATEQALREAQTKRSQRAVKAYKKRQSNAGSISNDHFSKNFKNRKKKEIFDDDSPVAIRQRVRSAIRSNQHPTIHDISKLMKPKRLSGRKVLMIEVLQKCFGYRGKCVPVPNVQVNHSSVNSTHVNITNPLASVKFVTACTVHQIGSFIIENLEQREREMEQEQPT